MCVEKGKLLKHVTELCVQHVIDFICAIKYQIKSFSGEMITPNIFSYLSHSRIAGRWHGERSSYQTHSALVSD